MAEVTGGERSIAAIKALVDKLGKAREVAVGFHEGDFEADGTPIATIAALMEFGVPSNGTPPRPFFRQMITENSGNWPDQFFACLKAADNQTDKALDLMGQGMANQLTNSMHNPPGPPNSPVTLLLKDRFPMRDGMTFSDVLQARRDVAEGKTASGAHTQPLVWTGTLLNSARWEVR